MFTGHLSGGPCVRNVVVQIPKFYAIRNPNLNPNSNLNPTLDLTLIQNLTSPDPMPIRFGQMTLRTGELSPIRIEEGKLSA